MLMLCDTELVLSNPYLEARLVHVPYIRWLDPVRINDFLEPLKPAPMDMPPNEPG